MSHFRIVRVALAAAVLALASLTPAASAQPAQPAPLVVAQLKPNVYWVSGGGGNCGIVIGTNGVIVIDAKTSADSGKELLADVAKLTPKPVTTLIETHSDSDHVNGAAAFPAGITIIAHENDKKEQETALSAGGRGAPPADKIPTRVVTKDREEITIDGVRLELLHWAPAHTSGDLVVYLPAERIVFTGDIFALQMPDPLIHPEKNGSSAGWITTAKGVDALAADQFVPGHGDVMTKAQVSARISSAEAKRAKIAAMVKDGKSLAEIQAAVDPPPAAPAGGAQAGRGGRGGGFASFTDVVYRELGGK